MITFPLPSFLSTLSGFCHFSAFEAFAAFAGAFFPSAASWVLKQKSRPVAKNIQLICIELLANSKYETFLVHCVLARMLRMYYRYSSFSIVVLRLEYTHLFLDVKACLLCLDMINHSDLRVVPTLIFHTVTFIQVD